MTTGAENFDHALSMQNSIREIFGSTFMIIANARAHNLNPPGKADAFELLIETLPPILEHCHTFALRSEDESSGQVLLGYDFEDAVIGICARDDGAYDINVVSSWLNATEEAMPINMVLLKILAYDCRPSDPIVFGIDEDELYEGLC